MYRTCLLAREGGKIAVYVYLSCVHLSPPRSADEIFFFFPKPAAAAAT
jgi:hypothetical protein